MRVSFDDVKIGDIASLDSLVEHGFMVRFDSVRRVVEISQGRVVLGAAEDEREFVLDEFGVAWA